MFQVKRESARGCPCVHNGVGVARPGRSISGRVEGTFPVTYLPTSGIIVSVTLDAEGRGRSGRTARRR